jgi:hypothetical protein
MAAVAAMDFFTVPTVTFRLLYCFGTQKREAAGPKASGCFMGGT